jgi:hypothetical protein
LKKTFGCSKEEWVSLVGYLGFWMLSLSLVSILYSKFQNSHDEEDIENLRKADIASTPHLASPILY